MTAHKSAGAAVPGHDHRIVPVGCRQDTRGRQYVGDGGPLYAYAGRVAETDLIVLPHTIDPHA